LNGAGFFASNAEKYPLGDIVATVKKAVGATPEMVCKSGSVQELRICFNKDFKVHNFPQRINSPTLITYCYKSHSI